MLHLLSRRSTGDGLTLQEVASVVDPLGWESLLERTRNAGRRLANKGQLIMEGADSDEALIFGTERLRIRLPN